MPDSPGAPLVGQYSGAAPTLDPAFFSTLDSIESVVSDLVYNADGSKAGASKSTVAEAWYAIEKDVKSAEKALATVNENFAKQIKAVKDALEGTAGEAFGKYATAILKTSEEVYDTLMKKQFGTTMGNVGHAVQSFADSWWQIHTASTSTRTQLTNSIVTTAQTQVAAAQTSQQVTNIYAQVTTDLNTMKTNMDTALLKDLQNALGALGGQYNSRAADLVPLYISDGDTTTAAPQGSVQQRIGAGLDPNAKPSETPTLQPTVENSQLNSQSATPTTNTPQQNAYAGVNPATPGETTQGQGTPLQAGPLKPAYESVKPGETPGDPQATPGAGQEGAPGLGRMTPEQQQALAGAKQAAGDAIDGLTAQTTDPARQQALQDAKQAAQGAIDGLTGQPSATGPGSPADTPSPGAVGGIDPTAQQALTDAKNAAGKAIDGLAGKTDDPKRKKALEDAKKAAEDAIDGLGSPADAPGQLTGGPAEEGIEAAKDAAGKAIDDLAEPGDSEARKQALEDAKQAASDALDGLGDPEATDGPGAADPQERAGLLDAKHEAQKAIDDLIGQTDDPERKQALEDAKAAMSDAIDKAAAPEHFQQVQDAKNAADKAIDGLGAAGDDPQRRHALDAAKAAADKAIGELNDTPELSGPEHDQAVQHAKDEAAKAIDALCQPDDTPAERQALANAKDAVNKAIDGIGGTDGTSALHDFLKPGEPQFKAPQGGLGGGAGGGPGGGPGLPATSAGPVTGGGATTGLGGPLAGEGPAPGKFDTQPFQGGGVNTQGGPLAPAASAQAPAAPGAAGAPMGPMGGMGGMGGGGGAQGEKEREPQIWMQAEQGAWGGEDSDEPRSHVLGRN
ncbi:large repetitive protein [Amycolatopsis sp. A133]|uniref:large repetitive protein n=1 Tax=Amycolatopsis sp. A133 TaxID=3064472 RepID=UPI0027F1C308|nr:large repetitive protein [Amycolatopsis sp. A133]MDQ7810868.1 large repetitive protein [Amycolatopsis sp. A133]